MRSSLELSDYVFAGGLANGGLVELVNGFVIVWVGNTLLVLDKGKLAPMSALWYYFHKLSL